MNYTDFDEPITDDEDFLELMQLFLDDEEEPLVSKNIRKRPDYFNILSEKEFVERFRLTKEGALEVLEKISDHIARKTERNHAVTPITMLLVTLRFYATGSMLIVVGDFCGIDKSTASRIVAQVSMAIARLYKQYIKMPDTDDEKNYSKSRFYAISRFPSCIGAIDCTHVKILSPGGDNAEIYRNRKQFFSFNVQAVCDADLRFINIVARWQGSAHDSTIFNNSRLRARLEQNEFDGCVIVGDSGYAVKPYLLTPLSNPHTREENLYNESQIRTRNVIERCFGIWKRRFPVLAFGMRVRLDRIQPIIVATAVLHNIARMRNIPDPEYNPDVEEAVHYLENVNNNNYAVGDEARIGPNNRARHALINNYFRNLLLQ
ncbi:putative nuclease HARBI1 [Photinus pyralis]|uniref:putative nuclease HARBI1 n=1 Tax=Photinus pyralis TaxID=7054 RepID=UPI00126707FC|nr:putative nuclease HARBI1 [Photinus pyralis]XP_031345801.1 putative nuclease HARBI1 [Photinus pyralis]XP_031357878.1 putative nuclease HARBI1 [Photinus pyralis]